MNMTIREKIGIVAGTLAAIGGIIALVKYVESRKNKKLQDEITAMDHEIKKIQLEQLKAKR